MADEPGPLDGTVQIDTDNVIAREVEGEVVILDLRTQRYVGGNRSAAVLWPLLEQGTTRDAMTSRLAEEFGLERERAAADVEALIGRLSELGLAHPVSR